MSKLVNLFLAQVGGDISTVDIYHTSINSGSLLESNISASLLTAPGVSYTVDDAVTTFIAVVNDGGLCDLTTGSFSSTFFRPYVRYFNVIAVGDNECTVEISYPTALGPSTGTLELEVDFRTYNYITIKANPIATYPLIATFEGWYTQEIGGSLLSNSSELTITLDTYRTSDSFYARFNIT